MVWQETLEQLEAGTVRAAYQNSQGAWLVDDAAREAIFSAFQAGDNVNCDGIYQGFVDKSNLAARQFTVHDNVRLVPGGSAVRRGAHVANGVIIMPPSYIDIGAYVGTGTVIGNHVLIGACAQVGESVHLSSAVQLASGLDMSNLCPVVIEDEVFLGTGVYIDAGCVIKKSAVLAAGVRLLVTTPIYDCVNETFLADNAEIPESAVVISGSRPLKNSWAAQQGLTTECAIIVAYRPEDTDAASILASLAL